MTFVPCSKLDRLSATFNDRILTSSTALSVVGSTSNSHPSSSSVASTIAADNIIISSTRPLNITTRFEAFSCKKVSKYQQPQQQQKNSTTATTTTATYTTTTKGKQPQDEDSQGAEEERDLLAATAGSFSFSAGDNNNDNNNNAAASSSDPSSSTTNNNQTDETAVEKVVPVTSAVMDAKYALDGYGFEGEIKPRHISILNPEDWLKLVSALTVQAAPASILPGSTSSSSSSVTAGTSSSGGLFGASMKSPFSGFSNNTITSSETSPSFMQHQNVSSSSSSVGASSGTVRTASVSSSILLTNTDTKNLWKDLSEVLSGGTSEQQQQQQQAHAQNAGTQQQQQQQQQQFPSTSTTTSLLLEGEGSGFGSSFFVGSASPPTKTKMQLDQQFATSSKMRSPTTDTNNNKLLTPTSAASLPLSHPSLIFFRLNAPDLDPQRKLGGLSLRSTTATPLSTPIGVNSAASASKVQFPGGSSSSSSYKSISAGAFPSAPSHSNNNNNSSSFGVRRDRDGFEVFNTNTTETPQSPTSSSHQNGGDGGAFPSALVTLSEHLFVYHKKTKMCVAVMTCGK